MHLYIYLSDHCMPSYTVYEYLYMCLCDSLPGYIFRAKFSQLLCGCHVRKMPVVLLFSLSFIQLYTL